MLRGLLAVLAAIGTVTLTPILDAQSPPPTAGGAIAGRIFTATGEPAAGIMLHALRQTTDASGQVTAGTTAMAQANERGEFRLVGLPEGSYLVIAAPPPPPPFGQPPRPTGAPVTIATYYPGTADPTAAQSIAVASEQVVDGVQFSMASTPGYNVSGIVVDEAGSPLPSVAVSLIIDTGNGGMSAAAVGRSDERGMFHLGGVVPGSYRLLAGTPTMSSTGDGSITVSGVVGIERAATGGVFVGGGRGMGAPGVGGPGIGVGGILPTGGIPTAVLAAAMFSQPIDVVVGNDDVDGLKLVVVSR